MGIEKLVPSMADLDNCIKVLARSATGQKITVYTTLVRAPRGPADADGPEELHVVLLDNGRSRILAGETAEILGCIRCGACLNACPIYRTIGGHAYGDTYPGPVGAILTPESAASTRGANCRTRARCAGRAAKCVRCGSTFHACCSRCVTRLPTNRARGSSGLR